MASADREQATTVPAPAQAPTAAPSRAQDGIAASVLRLQRAAGNASVTRMLQRDDSSGGVGTPTPTQTAPGDQSSAGGPASPERPDFQKLIDDSDTSGIRQVHDFSPATPDQRFSMIGILLDKTLWLGDNDRAAIKRLWDAFGTTGIVAAFEQQEALWDRCVEHKVPLEELDAVQPYRDSFKTDVKAVADIYMDKNLKAVSAERGRLNVGWVDDPFKAGGEAPPPSKEVVEVQQLAAQVQRADDGLLALLSVPVATVVADAPPKEPAAERGSGGGVGTPDGTGAPTNDGPAPPPAPPAPVLVDFTFHPDRPPPQGAGGPPPGREKEFRSYDEVLQQHKRLTAARAIIASRSPALFALSQGDTKAAGELAAMDPKQAAITLGRMLSRTEEAIGKATGMLAIDGLDWRDFSPIHEQLWGGMPARSGLAWNAKLPKLVAKGVIGDYTETQFWLKIGLGSLAAAAFLFSEIATGGMASFLWAAAGTAVNAGQAAMSYKNYDDLRTAAQTATSQDTRLVQTEQVDEAQAAAVLDTVFAFIDLVTAARSGVKAVGAAAAASRVEARAGLTALAEAKDKAAVVRTAIKELGPQETLRRSGMPADDLIKLVGGEGTEEGKALRAASRDASVAPGHAAGAAIDSLPAELPTELGRRLAAHAYDRVFKRWAELGTPEARLQAMLDILNPDLGSRGVTPLKAIATDDIVLEGEHIAEEWAIGIRPALLATDTQASSSQIWGLVVHEVEHAEQWFKVAQLRSVRDGKTAAELAAELGISEAVAERAIQVQKAGGAAALVPLSAKWREIELIDSSLLGGLRPRRDAALAELSRTRKELTAAQQAWERVEDLPAGHPLREDALAKLEQADTAYNTAEAVYVRLPEERAAYRAGGQAAASMEERLALVRNLETAKQTGAEAVAEMRRLEADLVAKAEAGKDVTYRIEVDFYGASRRAKAALQQIEDITDKLALAGAGVAP